MIVIPLLAIILNISIIGFIIYISNVGIFFLSPIASISINIFATFPLKIISQCWILIKSNAFKLPIGIEAEDEGEEIISTADNRHSIYELSFSCVCTRVDFILDGR